MRRRPSVSYSRRGKGSRWVAPQRTLLSPSFVSVDFETANRKGGASACQIALAKVANGEVIETATSLLKPPPGFDSFEFTYLHGIRKSDVKDPPLWSQIVDDVREFIGTLPVYAHNAEFDSRVWRDLDRYYGVTSLPQVFYCSYRTAQAIVPGLPNYKLPTVVGELAPDFKLNHHEAESDAEACALIIAALQRKIGT